MAKTIKFNLICDDKPVRTIEDLRKNFSVEDVLAYYNNKLLHRWLEVRGYSDELEKVNALTEEKHIEIIKKLIKIFNVICDDKKIEESVYMLEYLEERQKLCSIYEKENYKTKNIIKDYEMGYRQLVEDILENPDDAAMIKANISEMVTNYTWIFELNHRELFYMMKDKSMLAVMCLLMNEQSRNYYLPIKKDNEDNIEDENDIYGDNEYEDDEDKYYEDMINNWGNKGFFKYTPQENNTIILDTDTNDDKAEMFKLICEMIKSSDFKENLGDNLITFSGVTDSYWKDLEPKGKKYMIISMGNGDFVRSSGLSGGDLSSSDILNQFVIVDGIDYKSNSSYRELVYMEV